MSRWIAQTLVLAAALLAAPAAHADSPLTSTDLASAYADVPAVGRAQKTKRCEGEVLQFLIGDHPTDQKAAVINALGWNFDGQGNGRRFVEGLAAARGLRSEDLRLSHLTAVDRFVLGYLLAMDDYFTMRPLVVDGTDVWGATPIDLLDQAAYSLPEDFAVHYVRGLVQAQAAMDQSWCSVFLATQQVIDEFPPERRNLRPDAVASAQSYMALYEDDCQGAAASPAPAAAGAPAGMYTSPQLNEIYALVRYRDWIVAGTQGGVAVWDPAHPDRPHDTREEFICNELVVWGDAVWAGCDTRVYRYDGAGWKTYLHDPSNDAEYYAPLRGPGGELLVQYGGSAYVYNPAKDDFVAAGPGGKGTGAYDVLFRQSGELWTIDFLDAIHGAGRTYRLGSVDYPGTDPRSFVEDARGQLWVCDFEGGLFRLDEASRRFQHVPGLSEKGTGVAVDAARDRVWMLHYTQGPTLVQHGKITERIDLSDLGNMRDLLLADDGSLWVAGWGQLVHLQQDAAGGWQRTGYRVE